MNYVPTEDKPQELGFIEVYKITLYKDNKITKDNRNFDVDLFIGLWYN